MQAYELRQELEELVAQYEAGDIDSDGFVALLKKVETVPGDQAREALTLRTDILRTMKMAGWNRCNDCGRWYNGDASILGGSEVFLCDDCLDGKYDHCDRCGGIVGKNDLFLTDGNEYLCAVCAGEQG